MEPHQAVASPEDRATRTIRILLGLWFVAFGLLKYVIPWIWSNWTSQIGQSGLPVEPLLIYPGPLIEITAGFALLVRRWATFGAALVVAVMAVAIYVHYRVDPNVLPLGMQFPLLPIVAIVMALWVLWRRVKEPAAAEA